MTARRSTALKAALAALLSCGALPAAEKAGPAPAPPPDLRLEFSGWVGDRIQKNVDRWLLEAPAANPGMLEMFRVRDRKPAPSLVPWAGEFAGKYLASCVLALRTTERPDLRSSVRKFVEELASTQAEDGYLGPFPRSERLLGHWDLWGHYHVLYGLLLWYELSGDKTALETAVKAANLIAATYLDSPRRVLDAGSHEMNMAVLHALAWLYRLVGNERYLRLVREIEKDWEAAGDYVRQGAAGVEFFETPRPRWESLHDLQGLVELYRITGEERYRAALSNHWQSIRWRDRHNTGGFSTGEQAVGDPWAPGAIETCSTVAWMALSADYLQLVGDPAAADELELSTLNGLLGAQHPSGRWWTYSTPMDGVREASAHAIVFQARAGTPELNCCSVHGPRGLGLLSEWAVLSDGRGVTLNYYGPLRARLALRSGTRLEIEEITSYPLGGSIEIAVRPEREEDFALRLRIPKWSRQTAVTLPGGERPEARPGEYLVLSRRWRPGDSVRLELDMALRVLPGGRAQAGKISLYRGPLLLACDQRLCDFDLEDLPPIDAAAVEGMELQPLAPPERGVRPFLAVEVPAATGSKIRLSDFASAGAAGTPYRSWLPALRSPPPAALLDRPRRGERLRPGKILFLWDRGRPAPAGASYALRIAKAPRSREGVIVREAATGRATLDASEFGSQPGVFFWSVESRNAHGTSESEERSFWIDPSAPRSPLPELAPEPRSDGVLISARLRGNPAPEYGLLRDARGVAAAEGPEGEPGGALAFDGIQGRVRYSIPWFPDRDYAVAVRARIRTLPEGRIGQVFSAWAASMDDPLRITVERGLLFARIEAARAYSTAGAPIEVGKWMHVAAVKAGRKLVLYVDGEERASAEVPEEIHSAASDVALGGNPHYGGDEHLAATLSDFALYSRALSAEEVRALARAAR